MIKIHSNLNDENRVTLGVGCNFEIIKSRPKIQTRAFLIHNNLFYLKPIKDWSYENRIEVFPESPGQYILAIEWHTFRAKGWVQYSFEVVIDDFNNLHSPQIKQINETMSLWAPSTWEANLLTGYENATIGILPQIVKPGWVVYDVGANLGIYSIQFSQLVGEDGFIYCIEANPLCVYFLRANLDLNEISNCQILPIGLTKDQSNLDFTINYGNSALGVAKSSPLYTSKVGHEFLVHGCSLDILISTYQLKPPDMIKIDIEGGEGYAIKGMHKTLKKYLPVVLIEIHGRKAAKSTFHQLGKLNYRFQDIGTQQIFTDVKPLMDWFPDAVRQFLCTPGREQMFTD